MSPIHCQWGLSQSWMPPKGFLQNLILAHQQEGTLYLSFCGTEGMFKDHVQPEPGSQAGRGLCNVVSARRVTQVAGGAEVAPLHLLPG